MSEYKTQRTRDGSIRQSGLPKKMIPYTAGNANGLMLRGVVTATYVVDDPDHPELQISGSNSEGPKTVYCDVLSYSNLAGMKWVFIPRVIVLQDRGGLHSGRIWKPRAAKLDVTGSPIDANQATNPANLDGDHVLIGFMHDNLNEPIIMGGLPHPNVDLGNEDKDVGHRLQLKTVDGDPDFFKHHGSVYGIDDDGNFVVDLTDAYAGDNLQDDGKEPDPAGDGSVGNVVVKLPTLSTLSLEIDGGDNLKLELKDGNAKLTLGDGAVSVAIADHLKTLYNAVKVKFDAHPHPDAFGGTAAPIPADHLPAWDSNIESDHAKIPDTPYTP